MRKIIDRILTVSFENPDRQARIVNADQYHGDFAAGRSKPSRTTEDIVVRIKRLCRGGVMPVLVLALLAIFSAAPALGPGQAQGGTSPRYDEVCWLAGHNAYANSEPDYALLTANQGISVDRQLDKGARCLLEDIYLMRQKRNLLLFDFPEHKTYTSLTQANNESDYWKQAPLQVVVAHEPDAFQGGYKLLKNPFNFFREFRVDVELIHSWLDHHPTEIVTIVLESNFAEPCFLKQQALQDVYDAGLVFLADGPNDLPAPDGLPWEVKRHGWPKIDYMVSHNKRLVILSNQRNDGNGYQWNYMTENQYGLDSMTAATRAQARSESMNLDDPSRSLFFMNYFPDASISGPNCSGLNIPADYTTNFCEANSTPAINTLLLRNLAVSQRLPNYLAVDFLNFGDTDPNATPDSSPPSGPVQMTELINRGWQAQPHVQSAITLIPEPNADGFIRFLSLRP